MTPLHTMYTTFIYVWQLIIPILWNIEASRKLGHSNSSMYELHYNIWGCTRSNTRFPEWHCKKHSKFVEAEKHFYATLKTLKQKEKRKTKKHRIAKHTYCHFINECLLIWNQIFYEFSLLFVSWIWSLYLIAPFDYNLLVHAVLTKILPYRWLQYSSSYTFQF